MKKIVCFFGVGTIVFIVLISILNNYYSFTNLRTKDNNVRALWTQAHNSILNARGRYNDFIEVLEVDSHGRQLYYHASSSLLLTNLYVLVCQSVDEKYVYYYEDINFSYTYSLDEKSEEFKQIINNLKEKNDWNEELNSNLFIKKQITNSSKKGVIRENSIVFIFKKHYKLKEDEGYAITVSDVDTQNKHLYYILITKKGTEEFTISGEYILIINKDLTYDEINFMERLEDQYEYQNQLTNFKMRNLWKN